MPRVLLVVTTRSYRAGAFVDAARALNLPLTVASERPQALAPLNPEGHLVIDVARPSAATEQILAFARAHPLDAVLAADDEGVIIAAEAAALLNLPHHPPDAVRTARDKHAMRMRLAATGVPGPPFARVSLDEPAAAITARVPYPMVVKPLSLSMSRGVMRADDLAGLAHALERLAALPEAGTEVLVEGYVPGPEVALEGLVTEARLQTLAMFDKPDAMEGPYFEETIYITPSRLPAEVQTDIEGCARETIDALQLRHGPVHVELRASPEGVMPIEIAPRSIGGLCSRALRFDQGLTLEMLLLRHALGGDVRAIARERAASGVMMLPIPGAGVLRAVHGIEAARAVPGVDEVRITIPVGDRLVPLPEGNRYPGFVFARADTPDAVEVALRAAHRLLTFEIEPAESRLDTPPESTTERIST